MQKNLIDPRKCKVIFFDLEFYVPELNRKEGFNYNPGIDGNKLLGGLFYVANPVKNLNKSTLTKLNELNSFWIWDYKDEKELLIRIYKFLVEIQQIVFKRFQGKVSPVICGIGISYSDLPILFNLFLKNNIDSLEKIFELQNAYRILDLSQLSIAVFNNRSDFLYPKTKNDLFQKYFQGFKMESGKVVWDQFENKEYAKIISRVSDEIKLTVECYKMVKTDLDNFKILEMEQKRTLKKMSK